MSDIILEVNDLKKYFPIRSGFFMRKTGDVKAVDSVSFQVKKGQTLGLVGESGCGKSTLGRTICGLYDSTAGDIKFNGVSTSEMTKEQQQEFRRKVQVIFQDPYSSLDPRMTVARIIGEPLVINKMGTPQQIEDRVVELLEVVGLKSSQLNRYPHEFSGGQRQRIGIARALALNPEVIIADEPVSALDVSIQAQVLNLMKDLQEKFGLTYLFISHDLSVVEHMCDEIAVMYLGKIVEKAPNQRLYENPTHPYTKALLKAIPQIGRGKVKERALLTGDVPSPINPPSGCYFHPRCTFAKEGCSKQMPVLKSNSDYSEHTTACLNFN